MTWFVFNPVIQMTEGGAVELKSLRNKQRGGDQGERKRKRE